MSQQPPPLAIEEFLAEKLHRIDASHLRRRLRRIDSPQGPEVVIDGRRIINFSSNDYLGLANEPFLAEEFQRAVRDFGTGSGASRSISGTLAPHIRLEETLAAFKKVPAALALGSGLATALGVIPAIVGTGDVVILDKLAHAVRAKVCAVTGEGALGVLLGRIAPAGRPHRLAIHQLDLVVAA
ncbi:MAG: aminotransferase class I/II-fold pyridoxal phosphate-dependent enzyme, partial [Terrimicrobiaceae bacterium]